MQVGAVKPPQNAMNATRANTKAPLILFTATNLGKSHYALISAENYITIARSEDTNDTHPEDKSPINDLIAKRQ